MADDQLPTNFVAVFIRQHFDELLALDHWACERIGGPPGFTLSAYSCDAERRGLLWPKLWRPFIDWLALLVWHQANHCCVTLAAQQAALQSSLAPAAYAA